MDEQTTEEKIEDTEEERPQHIAPEHTKREVQPRVLYVDSYRLIGLQRRSEASGRVDKFIQANLYCGCMSVGLAPTLAYQTTLHLPQEAALRLGAQMIQTALQEEGNISDSWKKQEDPQLAKDICDHCQRRLSQLQYELDGMITNYMQRAEGDDEPEEDPR